MFNNEKYYLDATREFEEFEQEVLRTLGSIYAEDAIEPEEVDGVILDKSKSGLGILDESIWAKAKALKEGDEEKAKYEYISLRSQSLLKNALTDPKQLEVYYPYSNLVFIFIPAFFILMADKDPDSRELITFLFNISLYPFIATDLLSRLAAFFFSDKEGKNVLMRKKFNVIFHAIYIVGIVGFIYTQIN